MGGELMEIKSVSIVNTAILSLVFIMENFQTHMKIQDHVIKLMIYLDPRIIYDGANLVPSIPTHSDYLEAKLTYVIISSSQTLQRVLHL